MTHVQFDPSSVLVCLAQMVTADRYIIANGTEAALKAQADIRPLERVFILQMRQTRRNIRSLLSTRLSMVVTGTCVSCLHCRLRASSVVTRAGRAKQITARGATKGLHIHARTKHRKVLDITNEITP